MDQELSQESLLSIVRNNPELKDLLIPKMTDYIPHTPTLKQHAFLLLDILDAFYGGAVGGGKSDALLMAALQYVDIPGYNAILIRNTYKNLTKPEGLIPRAHEWLQNTDAKWRDGAFYEFPSGATLSFGYLDAPLDHFQYDSAAYQFVGIDEIVQIREHQALYLFSRLRRLEGNKTIPIRFRCASNPPQREQIARGSWVKSRYVDKATRGSRAFISAKLDDNPHLDGQEYKKTFAMSGIDPITRKQLEDGDWNIRATGRMFKRHWFNVVDTAPIHHIKWVRFWDMAATEERKDKSESQQPAYTCGVKIGRTPDGLVFISSVIRGRYSPRDCEILVKQTAIVDGRTVSIWMEQEPGSSGKAQIDHYRRNILPGFRFRGNPALKNKLVRWGPFASQAEGGNVYLINGSWVPEFLEELELAPDAPFLDQIDAASGGYDKLVGIGSGAMAGIRSVGATKVEKSTIDKKKENLKAGESMIEIWEGDQVVGYEKIGGRGGVPRRWTPGLVAGMSGMGIS